MQNDELQMELQGFQKDITKFLSRLKNTKKTIKGSQLKSEFKTEYNVQTIRSDLGNPLPRKDIIFESEMKKDGRLDSLKRGSIDDSYTGLNQSKNRIPGTYTDQFNKRIQSIAEKISQKHSYIELEHETKEQIAAKKRDSLFYQTKNILPDLASIEKKSSFDKNRYANANEIDQEHPDFPVSALGTRSIDKKIQLRTNSTGSVPREKSARGKKTTFGQVMYESDVELARNQPTGIDKLIAISRSKDRNRYYSEINPKTLPLAESHEREKSKSKYEKTVSEMGSKIIGTKNTVFTNHLPSNDQIKEGFIGGKKANKKTTISAKRSTSKSSQKKLNENRNTEMTKKNEPNLVNSRVSEKADQNRVVKKNSVESETKTSAFNKRADSIDKSRDAVQHFEDEIKNSQLSQHFNDNDDERRKTRFTNVNFNSLTNQKLDININQENKLCGAYLSATNDDLFLSTNQSLTLYDVVVPEEQRVIAQITLKDFDVF